MLARLVSQVWSVGERRRRVVALGEGLIDPDELVGAVRAAGAPVVIETRGGLEGQQADLDWLRARL